MEIWKDIKGYEGYYQVSNFGNVKSLDRWIDEKHHILEKVMSQNWIDDNKYISLTLVKNGARKKIHIHRIVAETFIEKPKLDEEQLKQLEVNHKDFNKQNNHIDNLEWVTPLQNKAHYHNSFKFQRANLKRRQTYYEIGKERENIYKNGIIFMYLYTDLTIHEIAKHTKTSTTFIRRMIEDVRKDNAK